MDQDNSQNYQKKKMCCLFIDFWLMKYLGRIRSARINLNKPLTARSHAIDSEFCVSFQQWTDKDGWIWRVSPLSAAVPFFGSGLVHQSRACPDIVWNSTRYEDSPGGMEVVLQHGGKIPGTHILWCVNIFIGIGVVPFYQCSAVVLIVNGFSI